MKTRFKNKDGTLSQYSFACGYVERYGNDIPRATLTHERNGYHVKGFDVDGKHFWKIFEQAREARAFARRHAPLNQP